MATKPRKPLFERLKKGLEEGIAHARGELSLRTVEVPDDPPEIDSKTLAALRSRAEMSQAVFASLLSVSTKTLQSWEQGVRRPSDSSRRLLQIFSTNPEVLCRSIGFPEVSLEGVEIQKNKQGRRRIIVRPLAREKQKSN